MTRPILCVDFDGVLHSYKSGWKGADIVPDPPVPGAMAFLHRAIQSFEVHIHSARSHQPGGIQAMKEWLYKWSQKELGFKNGDEVMAYVQFPMHKPSAMISLDDRAITFNGAFPTIEQLFAFKPWYKR